MGKHVCSERRGGAKTQQLNGKVVVKDGYVWHMGEEESLRTHERKEHESEVEMGGTGENVMNTRVIQRFSENWKDYEQKYVQCDKMYQLLANQSKTKIGHV